MNYLEKSSITYIVQTDSTGGIIDKNAAFQNSFDHIEPNNIFQILHPDDYKVAVVNAERVRRCGVTCRRVFECRTINNERGYNWGLFEIVYTGTGYFISGCDFFTSYEDGRGRVKRYEKMLRSVAWALNHKIRKHSSNIKGLISLESPKDERIAREIAKQFELLDAEILKLTQGINRVRE